MPKIKRKDADNARRISKLFRTKRGQKALADGEQEEMMTDPYGRPINVVLPEAEVATDFEARNKDEQNIYNQLGVDGVMKSRAMRKAVRDSGQDFGRAAIEAARFTPVLGDAIDAAEVYNAYETGKDLRGEDANYKTLGSMTAAGLLLPNILEKPAKAGWRVLKKAAQKFKPLKKAPNAKPNELLEVEDVIYDPPKKQTFRGSLDDLPLPSSKLREKASSIGHKAKNYDLYEGNVFDALAKGEIDNPFNTEAQKVAFEKLGLKSGESSNTARYLNWLSVREPELVEQIAKGNDDALYKAMNDKSLADGFMSEAETAYRGVDLSPDNPNVRSAIKDPKRLGERAEGEGVYSTRDPREAVGYATKQDPIRAKKPTGEEYVKGHRTTRKGSVAVVETDIDYNTPAEMLQNLEGKSVRLGPIRGGDELPEDVISNFVGRDHKVYRQGDVGAKFKIKDIFHQNSDEVKNLDMKFWGDMSFDPNVIDRRYFGNMSQSQAFKQAEDQLKSLREPEIKKLRQMAKMYDVAGTVARAGELGIVVAAPTVAILKGSSYLLDDKSNKVKVKRKEGMRVLRKDEKNSNKSL